MATSAHNTTASPLPPSTPPSVATLCWEGMEELVLSLTGHWGEDAANGPHPWLCSVVASAIIGLAGIVPMLIIPTDYTSKNGGDRTGSGALQLLLSFAVGGLLADVFLHLLPEAWTAALSAGLDPHEAFTRVGFCVLFGIFVFIVVEMLASSVEVSSHPPLPVALPEAAGNKLTKDATSGGRQSGKAAGGQSSPSVKRAPSGTTNAVNSHHNNNNNNNVLYEVASKTVTVGSEESNSNHVKSVRRGDCDSKAAKEVLPERKIEVIGYLNLLANGIDNFAHGLAVAGSFMVSYRTGVLTTSAILVHEVPHEIGDFAILLSSGFTRWEAAKAQLFTASVGLLGALFTLTLGSSSIVGGIELYILGFTAGAFLNISLVSVLPQLLKEERPAHSAAQMLALLLGAYTMAALAC